MPVGAQFIKKLLMPAKFKAQLINHETPVKLIQLLIHVCSFPQWLGTNEFKTTYFLSKMKKNLQVYIPPYGIKIILNKI